MTAIPLAQLVERAQRLAQMEGGSAAEFVVEAEWEQWINDGLAELYDRLVQARGEDHYATSTTHTLVAGTATYVLPADHYRTLELVAHDGSQGYHPLNRFELSEVAQLLEAAASGYGSEIDELRYRLTPTHLELRPTPSGTGWTLEQFYIPAMPLVAHGGVVDGNNGWEEAAVLHAAIKALVKEGSLDQAQALTLERGRLDVRIGRLADTRDAGRPKRIARTRRRSWC